MNPSFLAGPPTEEIEIPELVLDLLTADDDIRPVWQNGLGGLTFRVKHRLANPCAPDLNSEPRRFIKYSPASASKIEPLSNEVERLEWAAPYTRVPVVLEYLQGEAGDEVLITEQIPGRPAIHPFWRARPAEAAAIIGQGLRKMHDALPVAQCPFTWSIEERLAKVPKAAASKLRKSAPELDLVVCHGDACAPNTIITNFGHLAGHVDLGRLGVADRWADLAVASMSVTWNFGPGWESAVYSGYGIKPDAEKIEFYRKLWDAEDAEDS